MLLDRCLPPLVGGVLVLVLVLGSLVMGMLGMLLLVLLLQMLWELMLGIRLKRL